MHAVPHQSPLGHKLAYLSPESGTLAIKGGTVFTSTDKVPISPATVLVEGERIKAVGRANEIRVPDGARVIDATKKFVMPGLIDAHLHFTGVFHFGRLRFLDPPFAARVVRAALDAEEVLAAGFTTVRDLGHGSMDQVVGLRYAINERLIPGPRILTSGWAISQTGGHGDPHVFPRSWTRELRPRSTFADGPYACRLAVRENFGDGADLVKFYATERGLSAGPGGLEGIPNFTIEEIAAMADEAHRRGAKIAAHATGTEGTRNAILGGVDTIEHGGEVGYHEDLLDLMIERGVILVPTLSVYYWVVEEGKAVGAEPRTIAGCQAMMDMQRKTLKRIHERGVKIALGTDTGNIKGRGQNARELEMLVECGLTPEDALISGTRIAAEALGLERDIGTLESGKLGDILVLDADPIEDITCIRRKENLRHIIKSQASLSRASHGPAEPGVARR